MALGTAAIQALDQDTSAGGLSRLRLHEQGRAAGCFASHVQPRFPEREGCEGGFESKAKLSAPLDPRSSK
jgi:hypothetical protein